MKCLKSLANKSRLVLTLDVSRAMSIVTGMKSGIRWSSDPQPGSLVQITRKSWTPMTSLISWSRNQFLGTTRPKGEATRCIPVCGAFLVIAPSSEGFLIWLRLRSASTRKCFKWCISNSPPIKSSHLRQIDLNIILPISRIIERRRRSLHPNSKPY